MVSSANLIWQTERMGNAIVEYVMRIHWNYSDVKHGNCIGMKIILVSSWQLTLWCEFSSFNDICMDFMTKKSKLNWFDLFISLL